MLALAVVVISGVFVLAAMAGLADAVIHFVCWGLGGLKRESESQNPEQRPAPGITA